MNKSDKKHIINKFKAISDRTRFKIILLLMDKEMCVCEIVNSLKMSQPRISRHLKILTENDLLKLKKQAQKVFYRVNLEDGVNKYFIKMIKMEMNYEKRKNKSSLCMYRK